MIGYIKGKAGDAGAGKWNVTTLPGGAGGNWGGSYLAIPAASQHKEEAAELITWLTAPEQQAKVFDEAGNFPSTTGGIDHGLRRRPTRTSATRRSARSSPPPPRRRRCRSSARTTAW